MPPAPVAAVALSSPGAPARPEGGIRPAVRAAVPTPRPRTRAVRPAKECPVPRARWALQPPGPRAVRKFGRCGSWRHRRYGRWLGVPARPGHRGLRALSVMAAVRVAASGAGQAAAPAAASPGTVGAASADCGTGFCVDGVCCNSSWLVGLLETCAAAGSVGERVSPCRRAPRRVLRMVARSRPQSGAALTANAAGPAAVGCGQRGRSVPQETATDRW